VSLGTWIGEGTVAAIGSVGVGVLGVLGITVFGAVDAYKHDRVFCIDDPLVCAQQQDAFDAIVKANDAAERAEAEKTRAYLHRDLAKTNVGTTARVSAKTGDKVENSNEPIIIGDGAGFSAMMTLKVLGARTPEQWYPSLTSVPYASAQSSVWAAMEAFEEAAGKADKIFLDVQGWTGSYLLSHEIDIATTEWPGKTFCFVGLLELPACPPATGQWP
jgi:hypothetical protein